MNLQHEKSKQLGYEDAIKGLHSKLDQDSWYYQGYVDGQIELIRSSLEDFNNNVKELQTLVDSYAKTQC